MVSRIQILDGLGRRPSILGADPLYLDLLHESEIPVLFIA